MHELPNATGWFDRQDLGDGVYLIREPHVVPLMRCNIWFVRGRHRDLIVDTGMGFADLTSMLPLEGGKTPIALATHGHDDHIGSLHEFEEVLTHPSEASLVERPPLKSLSPSEAWGDDEVERIHRAGYDMTHPYFVTARPPGVDLTAFAQTPAEVTRFVEEGDHVDIGGRSFEVLHLPGHSPGSIGVWESSTGTLFSGDAVYDGPLLDELDDSDIDAYCRTMERLLALPVSVVYPGHEAPFGRRRLEQIARTYLERRRPG